MDKRISDAWLQQMKQDQMEGVSFSWEWPNRNDLAEDLRDARALLAKLNGVQFADPDERLKVVAEVSKYLAGGESNG